MHKFIPIALFFLFSLSSCIQIASTKTSYNRYLSAEVKKRIVFVGSDSTFQLNRESRKDSTTTQTAELPSSSGLAPLYLMNGLQFRKALAKGKWQVVYVCLPYCKGESCISYTAFCRSVEESGAQPWVVLRDLWHDGIVESVERYPLVGMDYRFYKKALCDRLFFADMMGHAPNWKQLYEEHLFFLFKGDRLVASGNELPKLLEMMK